MSKRVVVIGGGPGGYVAAIRGAQLGAEVHLAEKERLGGTCLNVGCIPTKALLHTAEMYRAIREGTVHGIKAEAVRVDWPELQKHKQAVVNRLVGGVGSLLQANGVKCHRGKAVLRGARSVEIEGEKAETLNADIIILAAGSEPVRLDFPGSELPGVIDSTQALNLQDIPSSLVIVGGGVIGIEFADLFSSLGSSVTVVELLPQVLPVMDGEIAACLRKELEKRGVVFFTGAKLREVRPGRNDNGLLAAVESQGKEQEIAAQYVLVAVGRRPRTAGLGLESAGVRVERGRILVDGAFSTGVPGIYAVGDCNGQQMLAHAASAQGVAAVEHALGHQPAYFPATVPSCIYTSPEAAGVGLTEEEAANKNISYKVGKFPLAANGKAVIDSGGEGLVKVIAGKKYGEILGVHVIGPRATDIIAEAALAIRLEATVDELVSTVHPHPTVTEAIGEAALAVNGLAVHWPPARRQA
ncbi:MAG: dihydrolipoyl dehydrogenase [Peptococcaceae bacterium]|jgi:dihydrolipoamide dehydrogenase|nr:dihydrolipoyl dehydrogenase [Peptococcaceae bacterium]MDH7525002.1 dihydrolipoyl dehydrogenase [Peptococcaceae bacterium]